MTQQLKLSQIVWNELDLVPANVERAAKQDDVLQGLLAVGAPLLFDTVALADAGGMKLSPEIKLLISSSRFWTLRLPLSVRPREGLRVPLIVVEVSLSSPSTSWSMHPERIEREVKLKSTAEVSAGLKLSGASMGTKAADSEEYVTLVPNVFAYGVGTSLAFWELQPAVGEPIRGIYILEMVIKAPQGLPQRASVAVRADVYEKGIIFQRKARKAADASEVAVFEFS
jgi:hypothetical protein